MPESSQRQKGIKAEDLAAAFLTQRGYHIVARNFRCPRGEIDIIAYDQEVLCFIEVRSRDNADFGEPLETIQTQKIDRIVRAAEAYLDQLPLPWPMMRFDALGIVLTKPPEFSLRQEAFEAR